MPRGLQQRAQIETKNFGGLNNIIQFSQLPNHQSPKMKNAWMPKIGAIGKRPGSIPLTATSLADTIKHLTVYRSSPTQDDLLAAAGTNLYKFNGTDTLTAQTMTNALNSADIYTVAFTDANNNSRLMITDGSSLKEYNGTQVINVSPAANDPDPNPPNDLVNVNAKGLKYCWIYSSHIMLSDGKDIVWYLKRFTRDYLPSTQYERFVRENDYITGPGVEYAGSCLIPMRRGWGVLTGTTSDDINGNQFLNTIAGVIAPRSIQKITYPSGLQTVAYLSDDGVYEIFDTGYIGTGIRTLSTKSLMKEKIDFDSIGLTEAEKKAAVGYFDSTYSVYLLSFKKGSEKLIYAYDVRNGEWYPFEGVTANSMVRKGEVLYFTDGGHLKKLDKDLYSDWDDSSKTTGTPIVFERYSPLYKFEESGYASWWDYYLLEARVFYEPSTLDITAIFFDLTVSRPSAVKNEVFVWGVSKWGEARWTNSDYSDMVNQPNEIIFHNKSKFCQMIWRNDRDEPVEIYSDSWKGRISGR